MELNKKSRRNYRVSDIEYMEYLNLLAKPVKHVLVEPVLVEPVLVEPVLVELADSVLVELDALNSKIL